MVNPEMLRRDIRLDLEDLYAAVDRDARSGRESLSGDRPERNLALQLECAAIAGQSDRLLAGEYCRVEGDRDRSGERICQTDRSGESQLRRYGVDRPGRRFDDQAVLVGADVDRGALSHPALVGRDAAHRSALAYGRAAGQERHRLRGPAVRTQRVKTRICDPDDVPVESVR